MRERWLDNYYVQRDKALYSKPYPFRVLIGYLIHRNITQTLHGQGVGRLTQEEIFTLKTEIWQHIDSVLASRLRQAQKDEPVWCLGGKEPTEADATLHGFITSVLVSERYVGADYLDASDDHAYTCGPALLSQRNS